MKLQPSSPVLSMAFASIAACALAGCALGAPGRAADAANAQCATGVMQARHRVQKSNPLQISSPVNSPGLRLPAAPTTDSRTRAEYDEYDEEARACD